MENLRKWNRFINIQCNNVWISHSINLFIYLTIRATSGDKRNNNKFSPCSLRQINSVLNSKARDSKGCFTEPQKAICGNGVVEAGEECDCGWEEDCDEPCCHPMRNSPKKHQQPCTLRPNKVCSPSQVYFDSHSVIYKITSCLHFPGEEIFYMSFYLIIFICSFRVYKFSSTHQGPCCTHDCQMKRGAKCRDDNGCRDSSFCDGRGPQCPPSTNKPNKVNVVVYSHAKE